jgi:3-deoxy-7-phosphoheptulonate synthase
MLAPTTGPTTTIAPDDWDALPAAQQPDWRSHTSFDRVRRKLAAVAPLVTPAEVLEVRAGLAAVAAGEALLLQAGDCAESFYETTPEHTAAKISALDALAAHLGRRATRPVLKIGRMAGQYGKPRSHSHEVVDGVELPAFRGHLVNSEAPSAEARRHDPRRMLWAYHFSDALMRELRARRDADPSTGPVHFGPWSSHDALVLDYEGPQVRLDETTGHRFLGSTHFPWIGERTGDVDGAHVRLLSQVHNPVACKVGPRSTPESVLALADRLDPAREPGRLAFIVRMGWAEVAGKLPPIARAVAEAGLPAVWLTDPMHGNTVRLPSGRKTRFLDQVVREAETVRDVLAREGLRLGGLHLETAATAVTECVGGAIRGDDDLAADYRTLCDPRLNPDQAQELIDALF